MYVLTRRKLSGGVHFVHFSFLTFSSINNYLHFSKNKIKIFSRADPDKGYFCGQIVCGRIFSLTLKKISRYFPNLELLSFLTVLALPKLSRRGEASRICSVIRLDEDLLTAARYCMINLVLEMGKFTLKQDKVIDVGSWWQSPVMPTSQFCPPLTRRWWQCTDSHAESPSWCKLWSLKIILFNREK